MEERKLTGDESMTIIQEMIQAARNDHRENGAGWLIWGWLLFIASVLSIVFIELNLDSYINWIWIIMLGIGLVVYVLGHARQNRRKRVNTYVQNLLDKLESGFFISLFVIIAGSFIVHKGNFGFGYFYILYAFWMYIHGTAIRFKPLLIGAYVNWLAAIGIFLVQNAQYDLIISAVAVLIGYLIPGYMLRAEYKRNYSRQEKV
jgi:Flp pilus assembly protein TadB